MPAWCSKPSQKWNVNSNKNIIILSYILFEIWRYRRRRLCCSCMVKGKLARFCWEKNKSSVAIPVDVCFCFCFSQNWNLNFFQKIHPKTIKFVIISRGMSSISRFLSKIMKVNEKKSVWNLDLRSKWVNLTAIHGCLWPNWNNYCIFVALNAM